MTRAIIDIGTNSVLLLIVDADKNVLVDEASVTRLGEGLAQKPFFLSQAMKRTLRVLKKYSEICKQHRVLKIHAVGTAAFRKAKNTSLFVAQVKQECGFEIEIISGEREAELTWKAASSNFGKDIVVIDVGGGSTEIVWYDSTIVRSYSGKKLNVISIPIGSVVLTETFCHFDPVTKQEFQKLNEAILQQLQNQRTSVRAYQRTIIATAGTATTLAAIDLGLKEYRHAEVHGHKLSIARLEEIIADLKSKTVAERKKIPGLHPQRADVILAGALILQIFAEQSAATVITVSDRGLRWGLV